MNKFIIFIILLSKLTIISPEIKTSDIKIIKNINKIYRNIVIEKQDTIFSVQEIPNEIYEKMLGKSIPIKYKDSININSLSYLQISYFGFDNKPHAGEMIVNSKIADEVLQIFKELYEIKYPIEKIKLIDEYDADDELSMSDNNTSSFCYRAISKTGKLSNHANRYSNRYKSTI